MRLANQQLSVHQHTNIKTLVSHMGAMQAQDFAMSKWAVGIRLNNCTEHAVEAAINSADIIRTHVLRPTWHLVCADDIFWMLQLTAPAVKAIMRSNDKRLELTDTLFSKANKIIEKALGKRHHSREELIDELKKHNIVVTENRFAHFMMRAELEGIVCSGGIINSKFTYALLAERVKKKKNLTREEALQALATRYFQSHGPAKLSDFMWWSGLTGKAAKDAVNMLDKSFVKESFGGEIYWLKQGTKLTGTKQSIFLLPAYDEYIISYKDRSAVVNNEAVKKVISSNGIFWPVVVVNGKVAGKWSRKIINHTVKIKNDMFAVDSNLINNKIKKRASEFAEFVNKKLT